MFWRKALGLIFKLLLAVAFVPLLIRGELWARILAPRILHLEGPFMNPAPTRDILIAGLPVVASFVLLCIVAWFCLRLWRDTRWYQLAFCLALGSCITTWVMFAM